jgi:hypothetical protein
MALKRSGQIKCGRWTLSPGRVKSSVVDGLLSPCRVKSSAVDGLLSPGRVKSSVVDGLLSPGRVKSSGVDGLLSPGRVKSHYSNDAVYKYSFLPLFEEKNTQKYIFYNKQNNNTICKYQL